MVFGVSSSLSSSLPGIFKTVYSLFGRHPCREIVRRRAVKVFDDRLQNAPA